METIKYKEEIYFLNDRKRILYGKIKQIKYEDIYVCGNCCQFIERNTSKICPNCYNNLVTLESAQNL